MRDVDIGITWDAFELTAPVKACSERLRGTDLDRNWWFQHAWEGNEPTDSDSRFSAGHGIIRGKNGNQVNFDYRIHALEYDVNGSEWYNKW